MRIYLMTGEQDYYQTLHEIVRLFFPELEFLQDKQDVTAADGSLYIIVKPQNSDIKVRAIFSFQGRLVQHEERLAVSGKPDIDNEKKRVAKLAVFRVLQKATGSDGGPWGILTGIRPTKIVHRLLDRRVATHEILQTLINEYGLDYAKAQLLLDVAVVQRDVLLLPEEAKRLVSIYIGIPFCPSRCLYCSFPAFSLQQHRDLTGPFLEVLLEEIRVVGEFLKSHRVGVQSVYVGGGTPTSLTAKELGILLEGLHRYLVSEETQELTVEAGRPDTLNMTKLSLLQSCQVNRLSINPQTMNDETLKVIGRNHRAEDINRAVTDAREAGFKSINMDVIIGLPGETVEMVRRTFAAVARLHPENLTVHTLAVKRASRLVEQPVPLPSPETVTKMLAVSKEYAQVMGMFPYYLYRQKRILGNLENIGYTIPGHIGIYNIQVMEERQTIIGLGVGAGSKYVTPGDWTLTSSYNPKDPQVYLERSKELLKNKLAKLAVVLKEG